MPGWWSTAATSSRPTATAAALAEQTGGETLVSTFDVTDPAAVDGGIAEIEQEWGTPDILVNNAGIQRRAPFTEFTVEDWNDLVATNLTSAFLVGQRVARRHGRPRQRQDHQHRLGPEPARPARHRAVQRDQGRHRDADQGDVRRPGTAGIQANALAPGYFATELTQALVEDEEFTAWVTTRTPAGRWGEVEDLVGGLVFLASPASDFVNGQILYVDGGMTAVV